MFDAILLVDTSGVSNVINLRIIMCQFKISLTICLLLLIFCNPHMQSSSKTSQTRQSGAKQPYSVYWLLEFSEITGQYHAKEYVPLLLVRETIEEANLTKLKHSTDNNYNDDELLSFGALIVKTYQKDSIWNTDHRPFKPAQKITKVDYKKKIIVIEGIRYKFEKTSVQELIRLIDNPSGKILISRLMDPLDGAEELAQKLKNRLLSESSVKN